MMELSGSCGEPTQFRGEVRPSGLVVISTGDMPAARRNPCDQADPLIRGITTLLDCCPSCGNSWHAKEYQFPCWKDDGHGNCAVCHPVKMWLWETHGIEAVTKT